MRHEQVLSPLDAAFLHVESDITPMHMGTVGILEGAPLQDADGTLRIDDLRRLIASRLDRVPKLRQQAFAGLLGEAPPVWLDDPEFDIADHVRVCRLPPPGTEAELLGFCGELMAAPLDRTRPLWELTFVEGLVGNHVAVVEKLHHSMADGLAAAELATVLLDLSPDPQQIPEGEPWIPQEGPPLWRAAARDLQRLAAIPVRVAVWNGQFFRHPVRRVMEMRTLAQAIGSIVSPRIIAPRSSLNVPITGARAFDVVRLSLDEVRTVATAHGVTINDVLLTVVAGGLHDMLADRGEVDGNSELQVLVPVGLSGGGDRGMANSVSALFVRIPIGLDNPDTVLARVSAEVKRDRRCHQDVAASAFLRALEPLPQGVLASAVGAVQRQPFFNLIVTNVPGPPVPLYALGAKLVEAFPVVPLAGNQSLGVAALSYEGQLNVGVLSDPVTCPDVKTFCEGVRCSMQALVDRVEGAERSTG